MTCNVDAGIVVVMHIIVIHLNIFANVRYISLSISVASLSIVRYISLSISVASLSIDQQTVFFECLNKSFLEEPGLLTGTGVSNAFSHSDDTSSLLQLRPEDVIAVSTEDEGYGK